ncbi:MAG TPA: UDP-N-acetylmuramoyl-L-alanyl-D-glutamate--2,6-diaminopimelate ligase [Candidatus Saccharibacteria bacterium]|nr:UDP-N-acetylmuramoyl-L-alanyl-D-glutamate--2,6-diaminopimelate ligase [Candidatus Saccharibacteria bacterium]
MSNLRKIIKKIIPDGIFRKVEPFGHLIEAIIANIRYGFPSRKMHIIGVTGTNGKTTTTFFIYRMLHEAGMNVGALSTVAYGYGNELKPQIEHITTAQSGVLQRRLRDFKNAGVDWVVVETSSHSLSQNRIWGVPYEIAVMTNVTPDHLDYHITFEKYLEAKMGVFKIASKHGRKFGVINSDDSNAQKFINVIPRSVTYGINSGDLRATDIKLDVTGSKYKVKIGNENYDIKVNIPGDFNVSNSLAAIAVGMELGLSKEQIEKGIDSLKHVEGRMAIVDEGQPFRVIIDHASTPDAFERFFFNIKPTTKGKLIAVFGSAGRRDENKRPIQGEIAGRYCDEVIITEEDDRDVDGNHIMEQIGEGVKKAGKVLDEDMFLVHDRELAIKFALERAGGTDDTVVLLGKGHEKTIERADGEHPWDETEITRKLLRKMMHKL